MEETNLLKGLSEINLFESPANIEPYMLIFSMLLGFILSIIVSWHYLNYSAVISNKTSTSIVFPFITLTTLVIITVVKSSLALSLGLVGALSIVRFRTPIKEPEELAYFFLSISIGLGLGANQYLPTIIATIFILIAINVYSRFFNKNVKAMDYYLSIEVSDASVEYLGEILDIIKQNNIDIDLRRFHSTDNNLKLVFFVDFVDSNELNLISSKLNSEIDKKISISFVDSRRNSYV